MSSESKWFKFDLGAILSSLALLLAGIGAFYNVKGAVEVQDVQIKSLTDRVDRIECMSKDISDINVKISDIKGDVKMLLDRAERTSTAKAKP